MKGLSVIIPMYNEEKNVSRCVSKVCDVLTNKHKGTVLLVVNDGSRDNTEKELKKLKEKHPDWPFCFISYQDNKGYGGAIQEGFKEALKRGAVFALVMDSDLTNDPNLITEFVKLLSTDKYDLVKASRYIKGGGMEGVPLYRQLYTIVGNKIAKHLFRIGINDCTNGFHAVRLSLLKDVSFKEKGFPFLLEELYYLKKKQARCAEFPYILTSRAKDGGVSKFIYSPAVLWRYLKYALKAAFI